ncbi:Peptide methionine sulfoxide reductase MsrA/MsrB [Pirellulimonas nuda]|uniref:Peptide methionine sulfoxide reductase MsrA n=1 Tax=Pirellulimonas nuda TaxID=2528009 RepID=A0A518D9M7_9BACT|nr:peptide-methionine (S)-S-oxide reductase MsrA [Pirellulimonas nuda]QDU88184.1 Peptide methionine sulfoxide reductase MsrA/MsrB [Pirellulimonas nuda]
MPFASNPLRRFWATTPLLVAGIAAGTFFAMNSHSAETTSPRPQGSAPKPENLKLATFGNGCFWCTEAVFRELRGVYGVTSGYTGGSVANPTYQQVGMGVTGHAEAIQVEYDPKQIGYADLLEVFWKTHDPTTLNRQGADVGTQYRSAVFYHDQEQQALAEELKEKLDKSGAFNASIVTQIVPAAEFYPAEGYHQDYYAENPEQRYCQLVIVPKLEKFRKVFADKLRKDEPETTAEAPQPLPDELPPGTDFSKVDWKKLLTPEQYRVTELAGTERPFQNEFWNVTEDGEYRCVRCGQLLFESDSKFESGCGWPSFDVAAANGAVVLKPDNSLGMVRTEVRCSRCDAHLGHLFDDGPTETGQRFCINSASLKFKKEKQAAPK